MWSATASISQAALDSVQVLQSQLSPSMLQLADSPGAQLTAAGRAALLRIDERNPDLPRIVTFQLTLTDALLALAGVASNENVLLTIGSTVRSHPFN